METKSKNDSQIVIIKEEINKQLADKETMQSLLDTTFKGLELAQMKRALLEGMIRGFPFEAFLKRDVYAIPYGGTYSLVTSIDWSRKIAARSGIIGSAKQEWEFNEDGRLISATATVKKQVGETIGDFSATVFFDEFNTGRNQWKTMPKHMLGKVAEMHALRKAFPEELAKSYVEEEIEKQEPVRGEVISSMPEADLTQFKADLRMARSLESIKTIWADLPADAKVKLKGVYEDCSAMLETETKEVGV